MKKLGKTTMKTVVYQHYQKYLKEYFLSKYSFFHDFLSDQQCEFQKGYSTHHCMLNLLEK